MARFRLPRPEETPNFSRRLGTVFIVLAILAGVIAMYGAPVEEIPVIPLTEVAQKITAGEISKVSVQEDALILERTKGGKLRAIREVDSSITESLRNLGVSEDALRNVTIEVKRPSGVGFWLMTLLPSLLPFVLFALFMMFMIRSATAASNRAIGFGQVRAKPVGELPPKKKVTFRDVAGSHEAKEELMEVVEFLKHPQKFTALGARIPKGVLLVGPPGTGKTLLAKAVAGEASVPFFHMSGSEFVEMFVGVGASRVRSLFAKAKRYAPAIVFVDELDAVGRMRGAGLGGGHDEREQTLNQILVEMDGFDTEDRLIVIAATNRPDVLDPALLRPGRFDRHVTLDMPDINEREEILKVHVGQKPLAKTVNLRTVAERTPGFSGADLSNLINEAAIFAARRNKKTVGMPELFDAIEKVILGPERKSHVFSQKEKEIAATHEAGHATVAYVLPHVDPVRKISIVSRGRAGGFTLKLPDEDKHLHSRSEFLGELATLIGGYAAESLRYGEITTGAANDLKRATQLARKIVTEYGMSRFGPITFGEREEMVFLGRDLLEHRNYSEATASKIDDEVQRLLQDARAKAEEVLKTHRAKWEEVAQVLVEKETIEQEEFQALMEGVPRGEPLAAHGPEAPVPSAEAPTAPEVNQVPSGPQPEPKPAPA
ncbi:MAG: cell division protease FtsH [Parcubacteria group bacterium Gr01-1014_38]|nr:MAG: cell division protease FtsH [Parcubacteria group bacterium Gr01-1014_38]